MWLGTLTCTESTILVHSTKTNAQYIMLDALGKTNELKKMHVYIKSVSFQSIKIQNYSLRTPNEK